MKKSVALSLLILVSISAWADNINSYSYTPAQINFNQLKTPATFNNASCLNGIPNPMYTPYIKDFSNDIYLNHNRTVLDKDQQALYPYKDTHYTDISQDKTTITYGNNGSSYSIYTTQSPDEYLKSYTSK